VPNDTPAVSQKEPRQLGIVMVGRQFKSPAFKLFIVAMNRQQRHFEYQFVPDVINDTLLTELEKPGQINRENTRKIAQDFPVRFKAALSKPISEYKIQDTKLPDYFVIVSGATFSDEFYIMRAPGISIIALGNWRRSMAPPSIFEFLQTLIVREAVASICPELRSPIHFTSKGCICDFNYSLDDVRLKVLNGFICNYCRDRLKACGYESLPDEAESVLNRAWIGDVTSTASVASTLSKFGVDLFMTKGLVPTWGERLLSAAKEDGAKELIRLIYVLLAAGLIFYLGWQKGH
jgi:hypothetical protein